VDVPKSLRRFCAYSAAVAEWELKGRPVRTDLEVRQIHRTHCLKCSWYADGMCKGCGCKVNESAWAVLNKIKMATQHCPRRRW
jgi:hypothetical protein